MTMDRVYQQHGFQQPQQSSQSQMQSTHPNIHRASQSPTQSIQQHQYQQQHLYRHHNRPSHVVHHQLQLQPQPQPQQQQHLYRHHNHPGYLVLQQQHSQNSHHHRNAYPSQIHPSPMHGQDNTQTVMHRPVHPPPPPPPARQNLNHQPQQPPVADTDDNDNYSNNLEEVIQAILAAKGALEKPIEERDSRDITLIDSLCSLVHGFDKFPKTVRRALAAQAVLVVIEEKGKELIVHDEKLDSFCVLIFGECEHLDTSNVPIRYYTVGDAFGVCEPTKETIRCVGNILTKCENCAFLCVKEDDFYQILTDDGNYPIKNVIRHLQASEECLMLALVDGYDRVDPDYVEDYLLLFRLFMTYSTRDKDEGLPPGMLKLCSALIEWLDHYNYRNRVVKIVLTWLSSYYHDFELNADFSFLFFKTLESRLLNLSMNNQLHLLHVTLSTKSKSRQVTISRSSRSQPLTFSIAGGYDKNCGIFVTHVIGSAQLKPGDQILEVNGTNFAAIELEKAETILNMSTHLSLTVKYNPSGYHEMNALPKNRRKSSVSSPYQPSTATNKFTFNQQDPLLSRQNDQMPPASPLFSNANFGFRSIIKGAQRGDKSKLSTFKQFVKHIRDTKIPASINNVETLSKISDTASDDQSNDIDMGKSKSNPDLPSLRSKDKQIEAGLSNIVRSDDLNPSVITENQTGTDRAPVNVLRVFNAANNDSRYLVVHEETTAQGVVSIAVKEFNLDRPSGSNPSPGEKPVSSRNWQLYEVSVVPESKTIKQKCLSEQTSGLAERASLCSRLYIKNNTQSSFGPARLDMGDDSLANEILKESPFNITLTSLNATLLAVELTLSDFDKFRAIEPQQFVYDAFFNYSGRNDQSGKSVNGGGSSADTVSLRSSSSDGHDVDILQTLNKTRTIPKNWMKEYQEFADICNKEMFWVICEILNERNIGRRVKIVKQFVRVADVCSQLRNFNSMFAIISGLGHSCIMRLKRTFDKLKPKYKNQLEKMRSLFDPSRNMLNYRTCLNRTPPPAIPLFPQIKKDLTFTKEGRSIFIRKPNDSDDEEIVYPTDTVKRKTRVDLLAVKSSVTNHEPIQAVTAQARSISYQSPHLSHNKQAINGGDDSILVNFAEIRPFTDRVRNVIKYSSIPYSNDLLTNTKDSQRNQAQIKKMHEEWHMRKRIRHYIHETLDSAMVTPSTTSGTDQIDSGVSNSKATNGRLSIIYDERTLYQRSLEVEPELNNAKQASSSAQSAPPSSNLDRHPSSHVQLPPPIQQQAALPPVTLNTMQPPSLASNSSPTLSKSSSLSSCSSFNYHLPNNYHAQRNSLTSAVGKFGTESTESLRKLQALSENVDDWRSYNGSNNGSSKGADHTRIKGLVSSMIFPPKGNR